MQNMQNRKVLLIEDKEPQVQNILDRLSHLGCSMEVASTKEDGLVAVKNYRPDLIILDIMLTEDGEEGFDILRTLRVDAATRTIPVIVYSITAKDMENRLRSIDLGALWCLDRSEGITQLEVYVRRAFDLTVIHNDAAPVPERGLRYDQSSGTIWIDGVKKNINLSALQSKLLALLYKHRGQIVSRLDIIRYVYEAENQDVDDVFDDDQIAALVSRLREKLVNNAQIENVRGQGFKLREEA